MQRTDYPPRRPHRGRPAGAFRVLLAWIAAAFIASGIPDRHVFAEEGRGDFVNPGERILRYLDKRIHIRPGIGLDRVVIGTPMKAVPSIWGAPHDGDRSGFLNRRTTLLYRSGVDSWIRVEGGREVEEIGIQGRTGFITPQGVRFGMPRHQVRTILGSPGDTSNVRDDYPERGIGFVFRSGTVYQIIVYEPQRGRG